MNRTDVQTLLGAAAAIDPTIPAPARQVLDMWAAMLDDVPADAGQAAVRAYYRSDDYRTNKRTVTPADIVGYWRDQRADQHARAITTERRETREAIEAAPSEITSLRELFARFDAERRGTDPDEAEAEAGAAQMVSRAECPYCGARPGTRCTTKLGRELTKAPAHPARFDAAHAAMSNA